MNILGVGAHYDDLELGCSGTLIKHVQRGDRVTMLVISDSAYRNPNGEVVRNAEMAFSEGTQAAEIIGAELVCLNCETLKISNDDKLARELLNYIEDFQIDTIYSHWVHDIHRDHQHAANATIMAGRHVPRVLMYRSNYYDSHEPFRGNFYSDISDVIEKKIDVIGAHKSELERVRYKWLEFFRKQNANHGQIIGVDFAECFEIVRYLT